MYVSIYMEREHTNVSFVSILDGICTPSCKNTCIHTFTSTGEKVLPMVTMFHTRYVHACACLHIPYKFKNCARMQHTTFTNQNCARVKNTTLSVMRTVPLRAKAHNKELMNTAMHLNAVTNILAQGKNKDKKPKPEPKIHNGASGHFDTIAGSG